AETTTGCLNGTLSRGSTRQPRRSATGRQDLLRLAHRRPVLLGRPFLLRLLLLRLPGRDARAAGRAPAVLGRRPLRVARLVVGARPLGAELVEVVDLLFRVDAAHGPEVFLGDRRLDEAHLAVGHDGVGALLAVALGAQEGRQAVGVLGDAADGAAAAGQPRALLVV